MDPLLAVVAEKLAEFAVDEILELVDSAVDNLKDRNDNTMNKDADRIKELTKRNRTEPE